MDFCVLKFSDTCNTLALSLDKKKLRIRVRKKSELFMTDNNMCNAHFVWLSLFSVIVYPKKTQRICTRNAGWMWWWSTTDFVRTACISLGMKTKQKYECGVSLFWNLTTMRQTKRKKKYHKHMNIRVYNFMFQSLFWFFWLRYLCSVMPDAHLYIKINVYVYKDRTTKQRRRYEKGSWELKRKFRTCSLHLQLTRFLFPM